jgi:hypothetical protein
MDGLVVLIVAGIGFLFLTFIVLFVCSIVLKWNTTFKIYFGCAVFLFSHLLLFCLVTFAENIPLPSVLTKYSFGILNLLAKLLPI